MNTVKLTGGQFREAYFGTKEPVINEKIVSCEESVGDVQTISSREVSEMIGKEHWEVLRMLEGYEPPKGSKSRKVVGILPTLNDHNIVVADYFIESTYVDKKGETRKCYECTKMGCEMLANKLTGEKGILFTAKYVSKFNEMEQYIKEQEPKMPTTYKEALKHLLLQVEENERLQLEVHNMHFRKSIIG